MVEKTYKEEFAKFFEEPTRDKLRKIIQFNLGEEDYLDFKEIWPDKTKIAKHILAFANSGGGCIVVGVKQLNDGNIETVGIPDLIDKAVLNDKVKKYLPDFIKYILLDFQYDESEYPKIKGKKFQVLLVEDDPYHIPFVSNFTGEGIRDGAIYTRKGTETVEASYIQAQQIINRRIETGHSTSNEMDLQEHLGQLVLLYNQIPKTLVKKLQAQQGIFAPNGTLAKVSQDLAKVLGTSTIVQNPIYPKEDYETFIKRMIEKKKMIIEKTILGIRPH